ncbi:zinc transporter ZIP4-like [Babylonia areolata]|uniref:zinc transporter ZIP4-like n=1 Tax=Babylonia areolata TaxID=304850 RepID=UPI003FD3A28E
MKVNSKIRAVFVLTFMLGVFSWPVSAEADARVDVFHEVLEKYQGTDGEGEGSLSVLSPGTVEDYVDKVMDTLSCLNDGSPVAGLEAETALHTCQHHLCLDTGGLITITGGNSSLGLTEEQFHTASLVALHVLSKGKHPCGATLNPASGQMTVAAVRTEMVGRVSSDGGVLSEEGLDSFLHGLGELYQGTDHGHDDADDHDDDHARKKRSGDDDDHDGGHGDQHDEQGEAMSRSVVEPKCLSADAVMYYLRADHTTSVDAASSIDHLATVVLYLMSQASALEESCRLLPRPQDFLANLTFRLTGHHHGDLTRDELHQLMEQLGVVPGSAAGEGDAEHEEHDHAHERRRRSAASGDRLLAAPVSRARRETSAADARCYSPDELMAVFDVGNTVTPEQLTHMSPALVYQKLYSDCTQDETHTDTSHGSPYKWWYGTATVLVVCLTSLVGVLLVPCMKRAVYRLGMALFMGLAVGSLTGDAVLHLIPSALGAHNHAADHEGHGHEGPVVVERYLWLSLVILAGMYGFYLLETLFVRFWRPMGTVESSDGHSHDLELNINTNGKDQNDPQEQKPTAQPIGSASLTVMIVVGDAVHNFADGLAIGAAFSSSTAVGIATGIAVFCHELPHELGDFAVLLKNGLTVCRAVLWNLISSLTAFVGLFLGLALATQEDVQTWIFAVAAGMFIYIALVDLLPQMTSKQNCQDTPVYLLNNLGILLGIFILLLIAIFEERIVIH